MGAAGAPSPLSYGATTNTWGVICSFEFESRENWISQSSLRKMMFGYRWSTRSPFLYKTETRFEYAPIFPCLVPQLQQHAAPFPSHVEIIEKQQHLIYDPLRSESNQYRVPWRLSTVGLHLSIFSFDIVLLLLRKIGLVEGRTRSDIKKSYVLGLQFCWSGWSIRSERNNVI